MENYKMCLLVVDDVEINRSIVKEIFCDTFEILEAADGSEALRILKNRQLKINAVILDIAMPEMDGFATLTEMRRLGILGSIPIIATTSDEMSINDLSAIDFGADDVIMKPFVNVLFKRRVMNAIEGFLYRQEHKELN